MTLRIIGRNYGRQYRTTENEAMKYFNKSTSPFNHLVFQFHPFQIHNTLNKSYKQLTVLLIKNIILPSVIKGLTKCFCPPIIETVKKSIHFMIIWINFNTKPWFHWLWWCFKIEVENGKVCGSGMINIFNGI